VTRFRSDVSRPVVGGQPEWTVSDPTENQTEASIGRFLSAVAVDDDVAIRETHRALLRFILTKVASIKKGRLYTEQNGYAGNSWYIRTGRSCWSPKGQSHLVEPTSGVRDFIKERGEDGSFYTRRSELYGTDEAS
jgi:hypothetical protein